MKVEVPTRKAFWALYSNSQKTFYLRYQTDYWEISFAVSHKSHDFHNSEQANSETVKIARIKLRIKLLSNQPDIAAGNSSIFIPINLLSHAECFRDPSVTPKNLFSLKVRRRGVVWTGIRKARWTLLWVSGKWVDLVQGAIWLTNPSFEYPRCRVIGEKAIATVSALAARRLR